MIPPTSIDGTDITGATIDGTDVQEITVDGDVVFSGIDMPQPDVGHFRADSLSLSNGQSVTTWTDESTQNNDVTVSGGNPIFETNSLNGLPGVDMNGGDFQSVNSINTSQPLVGYVVWKYAGINNTEVIVDGRDDFRVQLSMRNSTTMRIAAGPSVDFAIPNITNQPVAIKYRADGTNSFVELNGNTVFSGDANNIGRIGGYTLGDLNDLRGGIFQSFSTMYELAEFQNPSAQVQADAEAHLSTKWGVTF